MPSNSSMPILVDVHFWIFWFWHQDQPPFRCFDWLCVRCIPGTAFPFFSRKRTPKRNPEVSVFSFFQWLKYRRNNTLKDGNFVFLGFLHTRNEPNEAFRPPSNGSLTVSSGCGFHGIGVERQTVRAEEWPKVEWYYLIILLIWYCFIRPLKVFPYTCLTYIGCILVFICILQLGGGFNFFVFTPVWRSDPIWQIFFKWVETT